MLSVVFKEMETLATGQKNANAIAGLLIRAIESCYPLLVVSQQMLNGDITTYFPGML